jgi:hypothetical protein
MWVQILFGSAGKPTMVDDCITFHHNDAVALPSSCNRGVSGMAATSAKTDKEKRTVRTTISVPKENLEELERLAKQKRVSVAWVIRDAIEHYLTKQSPLFRK